MDVSEGDTGAESDDDDASGLALDRLYSVSPESLPAKPMHVEEAIMQLDLMDDEFLAFSNAETNEVNVVYIRDDGTYGLVEPGT
jgi:putative sigma-54 modulation protein